MKYELRSLSIGSLFLSGIPVLLFFLGLFGGLMTFLVMPGAQLADLSIPQRLAAAGLFSLLYMALMVCLLVLVAFLYNFFTQTVGMRGLSVVLSSVEEEPEDEEMGPEAEPKV